jgi:hypothetical protein
MYKVHLFEFENFLMIKLIYIIFEKKQFFYKK